MSISRLASLSMRITDCCNWVKPVAITTLALAVAGVAAAIFLGQFFAIVGFALLGVTSLLLILEDTSKTTKIELITAQMEQNNQALERSQKNEEALVMKVDEQEKKWALKIKEMEEENAALQENNKRLQESVEKWSAQEELFRTENEQLKKTTEDFEKSLSALNPTLQTFHQDLQTQARQVLTLGAQVGSLKQASDVFSTKAKEVHDVLGMMEKVASLPEQMEAWKKILQTLFDYLVAQQEALLASKKELGIVMERLEERERNLSTRQQLVSKEIELLRAQTKLQDQSAQKLVEVKMQAEQVLPQLVKRLAPKNSRT